MWKLHQTAQQTHSRPSQLVGMRNKLEAYLLDSCVVTFGIIIDNALHERVPVGPKEKNEWKQKYTLDQLLDNKFYLPDPLRPIRFAFMREEDLPPFEGGFSQTLALAAEGVRGIQTWKYVPPESNGNGNGDGEAT